MQQIKKMIVEEKYKLFGDREHDHKRAFIMILSLSVEMIAQSRNVETFQETAQLAVKMLEKTNYLRICNPHELSVFLRCVTQVEKLVIPIYPILAPKQRIGKTVLEYCKGKAE